MTTIGLIGDRDDTVLAHQAIPKALSLAAQALSVELQVDWLATDRLANGYSLESYDGLWCVPASPYRSMQGALAAIQYARVKPVAFLGSCGGFQHAVSEFARNVAGLADAEHAETAADAPLQIVAPLQCALVEQSGVVNLRDGSRLRAAYGRAQTIEGYHCRYGLNADYLQHLLAHGIRVAAVDDHGDIRALELSDHPFYVMTLFQPERAALRGELPAVVAAFVNYAVAASTTTRAV